MKRPLAYITAPWGENRRENEEHAARYCRQVYDAGYSPICPASSQAPYRSPRRKRQVSFAPLLLLSPRNPLRWACAGSHKMLSTFLKDSIPQEHKDGIDMARDYLRRSHVLVVCGDSVTETMKNDIAVAERLHITATTLDGILTVKGQGRKSCR